MNNILIVDDEKPIRDILSSILEDEGYTTYTAESAESGWELLKECEVGVIFLDLWLPGMGGMELLAKIKEELYPPEVIIISGHANVDIAVQAIKYGAYDCIEKPLDLARVLNLSKSALEKYNQSRDSRVLTQQSVASSEMIGDCEEIIKIKQLIQQLYTSDTRVLILGENGTGKEVVAREIHKNSSRRESPFVEVNCAAIPENLIESELFGHEKGAFTGAVESRKGKFEAANGGTLFLDEIADMSLTAQAKVLRAIQEQKFHRVGSDKLIDVDIRIISATNKDINQEIRDGRFREDLYFRLGVIPINLPPLRDRDDDILLLANYFLQIYNKENNSQKRLNSETATVLKHHSWPGNVRELKNFIEKVCIISSDDLINIEDFVTPEEDEKTNSNMEEFMDLPLSRAKEVLETKLIEKKLKESNGNITKAAEALGIYPSNLHNKIKKYGITIRK